MFELLFLRFTQSYNEFNFSNTVPLGISDFNDVTYCMQHYGFNMYANVTNRQEHWFPRARIGYYFFRNGYISTAGIGLTSRSSGRSLPYEFKFIPSWVYVEELSNMEEEGAFLLSSSSTIL